MTQPFFIIILSIIASLFFGVISNWIYDLIRDRGYLSDRPPVKVGVLIFLIGTVFLYLTNLRNESFEFVPRFLAMQLPLQVWIIFLIIIAAVISGYMLSLWRIRRLVTTLRNRENELKDLRNRFDEFIKIAQGAIKGNIINPK